MNFLTGALERGEAGAALRLSDSIRLFVPAPAAVAGTTYDTSYCRQYTKTTQIGGQNYQSTGTACRQADGTWREVN